MNAWPPLRELQNGQGAAHDKAGYTNATALTTGSKKLSSLLVGRVHIRIVRLPGIHALVAPTRKEKANNAENAGELSKLFVMLHNMKLTSFSDTNNGGN